MNSPTPPTPPNSRMVPTRTRRVRIATFAGVALLTAASVLAQSTSKKESIQPPTPPAGTATFSPILSIVIGVVIGGLVLGSAFIPSKRGHRD